MLVELAIRDIVLIDALTLTFSGGLTVLTGETGAGKSILLDAFTLALGGRGDGGLVRAGQPHGQVTAVFDFAAGHPAQALALAAGVGLDGDMILRRVQMADGRTRAFLNDQPVSAQTLRAIGATLVEIHGQHAERALLDPSGHRTILDAFGGMTEAAQDTRAAFRAAEDARAARLEEAARLSEARKEAAFLRHAHDELAKLAPEAGEEEGLAQRRTTMMQAEKVVADVRDAYEAIVGDGAPIATVSGMARRLDRRQAQAPALIDPCVAAVGAALDALERARDALENALDSAAYDPRELERVEERLFALRGAGRKYQTPVDGLTALAARFAADLAALAASEDRLVALEREETARRAAYTQAARALSRGRAAAARTLDGAVMGELAPLKLERARFSTRIDSDPDSFAPDGFDRVEFWVETNPGARPGPLMKVASGGELARFMLALKVALADKGSAPTLVFDEIDTGVGGAVADAIGQRLARLAAKTQVLAVTHAPQVAARAARHLQIAKDAADKGKRMATRVVALDAAARREEIARMLSGATITEEARAAARRLLDHAP